MTARKRKETAGSAMPHLLKVLNMATPQVKPEVQSLFDNLPEIITPGEVEGLGLAKTATITDWKYRPAKYGVPDGLFLPKRKPSSPNRLNRDVLKEWVNSWDN